MKGSALLSGAVSAMTSCTRGSDSVGRIAGFDGLRAIAFLLVFLSHNLPGIKTEMAGSLGVWLFFVLSGFLITRNLHASKLRLEHSGLTYKAALLDFYIRRTARIAPAYYGLLLALMAAAVVVKIEHFGWVERVAYLTYTTNIYVASHGWVGRFGHLWSLAVEEQFYLLFAPIALSVASHRIRFVCWLLVCLGVVINIWLVTSGASRIELDVNSLLGFGLLGLGGVSGLAAARLGRTFKTASILIALVLGAYLATLALFPTFEAFCAYGRGAGVLVAALLLLIIANPSSTAVAVLEWPGLARLGEISYGAYLYHHFISFAAIEKALQPVLGLDVAATAVRLTLELAVTVCVALVSWHFLEKPIREWGRRTSDRVAARSIRQISREGARCET